MQQSWKITEKSLNGVREETESINECYKDKLTSIYYIYQDEKKNGPITKQW